MRGQDELNLIDNLLAFAIGYGVHVSTYDKENDRKVFSENFSETKPQKRFCIHKSANNFKSKCLKRMEEDPKSMYPHSFDFLSPFHVKTYWESVSDTF